MKISNWKMNHVVPGSSVHAPIILDSRESSYASSEKDSTVTVQSEGSKAYEFEVNQPASNVFYGQNERFRAIRDPFAVEPTRNSSVQRNLPESLTTRHELANNVPNDAPAFLAQGFTASLPRQSPHPPANSLEFVDNMATALGIPAEGLNLSSPMPSPQPSANHPQYLINTPNQAQGIWTEVSGLRRSQRKRNEAIYNEYLLANRLPRLTRWKGDNSKKTKPGSLRNDEGN